MSRVGRAVERGESQGFMKVVVAADSGEILGAALLGLNADEVVHSLLDVMYAHAPYTLVRRAVHIHLPSVSFFRRCLGIESLAGRMTFGHREYRVRDSRR